MWLQQCRGTANVNSDSSEASVVEVVREMQFYWILLQRTEKLVGNFYNLGNIGIRAELGVQIVLHFNCRNQMVHWTVGQYGRRGGGPLYSSPGSTWQYSVYSESGIKSDIWRTTSERLWSWIYLLWLWLIVRIVGSAVGTSEGLKVGYNDGRWGYNKR